MFRRAAALASLFACTAWAQFTGLGTPSDGSIVYFASSLRLKDTAQPNYGKLFAADESGVRLVRSRPLPAASTSACDLSGLYVFTGAEVSGDGQTIAASMSRGNIGGCSYPLNRTGADLITPGGESDLAGFVRISSNGRYVIELNGVTGRTTDPIQGTLLDLKTGIQSAVPLPQPSFANPYLFPDSGRIIADDSTAIVAYSDGSYVVRAGAEPQGFPVVKARVLAIDAAAAWVLYVSGTYDLRIYNLQTGEDRLLLAAAYDVTNASMSDDARRVVFRRGSQAFVMETDGSDPRPLLGDAVNAVILSGRGRVAYAVTFEGRLLKIDADRLTQIEIIGRTPHINSNSGPVDAGFAITMFVGGVDLAHLGLRVGGRAPAILDLSPTSIHFLVPWDFPPAGSPSEIPVVVETPADHSPFGYPEATIQVSTMPRAGLIAHQNWDGPVNASSWPRAGEIIHVWAVGLGGVSPEVPGGAAAPSAEPLARLAPPMVCSNSEILYAGLAPGYIERVYQVDLRIGPVTGYQKFICSVGANSFNFLTLLVLP